MDGRLINMRPHKSFLQAPSAYGSAGLGWFLSMRTRCLA
jgi:hypothetical protein